MGAGGPERGRRGRARLGAVKGGPGVAVALGWVLTGAESPERHALRGAVCGYLLAVQVGRELLGTAVSRMVLEGTSFAGGLALMAEALAGVAGLLAVAVPSFGWAEGRRLVGSAGSAGELNRYLERRPEQAAEDLMVVLRYFNPMHFVPLVRGSTLVGVGLIDEVVPRRPWRPSPPRWAGHAR